MTFFQQMCQLVAVLGMHYHLKALAGFGLLGRHPASFVRARPGWCIGRDLVFDRFRRFADCLLDLRGDVNTVCCVDISALKFVRRSCSTVVYKAHILPYEATSPLFQA